LPLARFYTLIGSFPRWQILCLKRAAPVRLRKRAANKHPGPATDHGMTFNGDYSGKRFSSLQQINTSKVTSLQLQWSYRITRSVRKQG
jgi:alcohol dehydrogenase (cytochrome c)